MSYKSHFRRFIDADPERIHFAAHSHHFWPDVSFDAHAQAWLDAARSADQKWERIFSEVIPRAQSSIARRLGLSEASSITFAPNTHELVMRIVSCLPRTRPLRVLTTDAEFHSFARQAARLEEDGAIEVTRVPSEPLGSFVDRFAEALAKKPDWDLVYLSHVFFNSGYVVPDLERLAALAPESSYFVIDGYHAFGAVPIDLGALEQRVFYLAGGYKYAMSGEGCSFAHVPSSYGTRPRDTGWFAEFGALESANAAGQVAYGPGGARFLGATFDPSGLYRFNAVMSWLDEQKLSPAVIHDHVARLQELFVSELSKHSFPLDQTQLVVPVSEKNRGHFLTFRTPAAASIHARLLAAKVVTDVRGDRLRFGFGIYHDEDDIHRGIARMTSALA